VFALRWIGAAEAFAFQAMGLLLVVAGRSAEEGTPRELKSGGVAALRVLAGRHWILLVLLLAAVSKSEILVVS